MNFLKSLGIVLGIVLVKLLSKERKEEELSWWELPWLSLNRLSGPVGLRH